MKITITFIFSICFCTLSFAQAELADNHPISIDCVDDTDPGKCTISAITTPFYSGFEYPSFAMKNNLQGKVLLEYLIDTTGAISDYSIVEGIGGGCDQMVLQKFKWSCGKLEFNPAIKVGKAVNYKGILPVSFKLDEDLDTSENFIMLSSLDSKKYEKVNISTDNSKLGVGKYEYFLDSILIEAPLLNKRNLDNIFIQEIAYDVIKNTQTYKLISREYGQERGIIPYKKVDEMPYLIDCKNEPKDKIKSCSDLKLIQSVYRTLQYPAEAKKKKIQGSVFIQFEIDKNGNMKDERIVRDIGGGCGEAALKVIEVLRSKNMKWEPGKANGKPVDVTFTLPMKFKLE